MSGKNTPAGNFTDTASEKYGDKKPSEISKLPPSVRPVSHDKELKYDDTAHRLQFPEHKHHPVGKTEKEPIKEPKEP